MIEAGRVCIVEAGRRKGEKVTVKKVMGAYAVAVDSKNKERKYSVRQLTPTEEKK